MLRMDDVEPAPGMSRPSAATRQKQALDDRGLIRHQMRLGAGLIAGALSILFQMTRVLDGRTATAALPLLPA